MDGEFQEFAIAEAIRETLRGELQRIKIPALAAAAGHLIGQGKLIRPRLQLAVYNALTGQPRTNKAELAAAIELVHTFTLIHDDLPCMDDAQLRRGLPAVHVAFGEANAVLAGDALLNLAYLSLLQGPSEVSAQQRLDLVHCLAEATHAVIEGQVLDIEAEGQSLTLDQVKQIHRLKTAALISAACEMGVIMAGPAFVAQRKFLGSFGHTMGLLFQAQDDLLFVQSDVAASGKTLSSDADKDKATLPRVIGVEATLEYVSELKASLSSSLSRLQLPDPQPLQLILDELTSR